MNIENFIKKTLKHVIILVVVQFLPLPISLTKIKASFSRLFSFFYDIIKYKEVII